MIPLTRPVMGKEELKEISKTFATGWVAGLGPTSDEFVKNVQTYLGAPYVLPVSNCTNALHLGLLALNVKKGDEVIVADFTFPATGHAVLYVGAKPVFCDVKPDTYNIDEKKIESYITKRTKAIIAVHTFGNPCNMSEIMRIAKKHKLLVIEDAACSFGATIDGKQTGLIGDVGCYSLHARKGITTGEGGILVTKNKLLYNRARHLVSFGMQTAYSRHKRRGVIIPTFTDLGYNYRLSDIQAAIGIAQLRKLKYMLIERRRLAQLYTKTLSLLPNIKPQKTEKSAQPVYQAYVVRVPKEHRDKLIIYLRKHGIQAQIGTYSSCIQPVYKTKKRCMISIATFESTIALPLYFGLKDKEVHYVCEKIAMYMKDETS